MTHKLNLRDVGYALMQHGGRMTNKRILAYEKVHGPVTHMHCNLCNEERVLDGFTPSASSAIRRDRKCKKCVNRKKRAQEAKDREAGALGEKPMNAYGCRYPAPTEDPDNVKDRNAAWKRVWAKAMGEPSEDNIKSYANPYGYRCFRTPSTKPIPGAGPAYKQF